MRYIVLKMRVMGADRWARSGALTGCALASLAASTLLFSPPAQGQVEYRDRVAVLPIVSPVQAVSASDIHRAVGQATRRRMGVKLLSAEEVFVANKEGLDHRVRDCGPDVQCISSRMRRFSARLGLVVVLDRTISPAVLSLQLVDTDLGRLVRQTLDELGPGESSLEVITRRTAELLDHAGYIEAGRLRVLVEPPAAHVRLKSGQEPDPGALNVFTLAPGAYAVVAEYPGFEAEQTDVTVRGGQETQVELALDEKTSFWQSPWLWVSVGVVVAGAVTAGAILASQPEPRVCFRYGGRDCD